MRSLQPLPRCPSASRVRCRPIIQQRSENSRFRELATSAPYAIPVVVHAVRQLRPRSILDVGTGFGKYGVLFREYTDIWDADEASHLKRNAWRTRIDGIEVYPLYLSPVHDYIYDHVYVGDVSQVIDDLGHYDLVFMGDVLEHFAKAEGDRLVRKLFDHADKCVLLTYPRRAKRRGGLLGNEAEAHRSEWNRRDFSPYPRVAYTVLEGRADVVALAKPPHDPPFLVGCFAARRRKGWKGRLAAALVHALGPNAASLFAGRILGRPVALRAE